VGVCWGVYDYGTDPLSYGRCGFIWNHLMRKGISFRNFGETDLAEITKGKTRTDAYNCWKNKNDPAQYKCVYAMKSLEKDSDLHYPGWNMGITDQIRADAFINALKEYEASDSLNRRTSTPHEAKSKLIKQHYKDVEVFSFTNSISSISSSKISINNFVG
jgi:hypothetical protein